MTIPTLVLFTTLWLVYFSPCNGLHSSLDKQHLETSSTVAPYWYSMMKKLHFIGNSPELPEDHINDVDKQLDGQDYRPLLTGSGRLVSMKRSSELQNNRNRQLLKLLNPDPMNLSNAARFNSFLDVDYDTRQRRKFPEVDSRGFDEDIFDEGFGEWSPMKRSSKIVV
ncbi:uncharacterized protein LOC111087548 [Limulus polyphemus]|uniref:Uncharacterized protein LOC111087548 n=1 Tax=Limulus polyphemus TaxID=6850 RepID=A0ABM1T2Y7_LIMPO|nr:uncharacterized protein LOC111087548 [Limulus polyphemus]